MKLSVGGGSGFRALPVPRQFHLCAGNRRPGRVMHDALPRRQRYGPVAG